MTKSGGFSIKKRHRKLGALIGLAALAVPFAANLGTLGDAIHAVTGPQNVYESKLLNVKLETSQDKAKTTWDLEFDRSDMSVSEQTVKFKLDLEKAGLTDAEIAVKDGDKLGEPLDMREGIVDAVLKTQSTHLILTAISSNEDKHDITLPVTELGLYNEENGENLLPADNRSVDLTMAFEQVAEVAESVKEEAASSSETITEAVAKEEETKAVAKESSSETVTEAVNKEEKKSKKDTRVIDGYSSGFVTTAEDPATTLANSLTPIGGDQIAGLNVEYRQFTSPDGNGNFDADNFQIWSNKSYAQAVSTSGNVTNHNTTTGIEIRKKYNLPSNLIDSLATAGGYNHMDTVRRYYHSQYEQTDPQKNRASYLIEFNNTAAMSDAEFTVLYDNVGVYVDQQGKQHTMGATVHLSKIVPVDNTAQGNFGVNNVWQNSHYIDMPNNLYSGILYQGILSLDVTIQFFATDDSSHEFTNIINLPANVANFTFDSLNNFGRGTRDSSVSTSDGGQWDVYAYDIQDSTYAETVARVVNDDTDLKWDAQVATDHSAMKQDSNNGGKWYSTTHGYYAGTDGTPSMSLWSEDTHNRWVDIVESNTFERGALTYKITGTSNTFRLFSGDGNTWQTWTSAQLNPIELPAPHKTVTDASSYSTALAELNDRLDDKTTQYGEYDTESISQASVATIDGGQYFTYNYWVFQPTYNMNQSIAKPNTVTFVDQLPKGITLRDYSLEDTATPIVVDSNSPSIKGDVLVTVPGQNTTVPLSIADGDYTVALENVTLKDEKGQDYTSQQVTVTSTAKGIGKTYFNGQNIGVQMRVKVPINAAIDANTPLTWKNVASTYTDSFPTPQETNPVTTNLGPLQAALRVRKVDDNGRYLSGATFELERQTKFTSWNNKYVDPTTEKQVGQFDPTSEVADVEVLEPSEQSSDNWLWDNETGISDDTPSVTLLAGTYTLSETATPDGYNGIQPLTFTLNYERLYPDAAPGTDDYDKLKMVVTYTDTTGNIVQTDLTDDGVQYGVQLAVANNAKPTQVLLKKVDADGKPLGGAGFQYRSIVGDTMSDWKQFTAIATSSEETTSDEYSSFSMGTETLQFYRAGTNPIIYQINENKRPSGYALNGDIYIKVIPKADFSDYAGIANTPTTDVGIMLTDSTGTAKLGWLDMTTEKVNNQDMIVGSFKVANNPKSIFPRVGGTGIQAYIGAGLIVMLIAGGAAWYIKRRQNQ